MKNSKLLYTVAVATLMAVGNCFWAFPVMAQETEEETHAPGDFPVRSSLGEMAEAQLPALSDSVIKDPAPMARVVSKNASPSEQLLGRITPEVFHEMADLERGNVFLKLQTQREQLKNDLEKLKASYREARLEEIQKRESVIRTRVEWMQEQEKIRQELLEKRKEIEGVDEEIAELEKEEDEASAAQSEDEEDKENTGNAEKEVEVEELPALTILDIKGMKKNLVARLVDEDGKIITVKTGTQLPSGHVVKSVSKDHIIFERDGIEENLGIEAISYVGGKTKGADAE